MKKPALFLILSSLIFSSCEKHKTIELLKDNDAEAHSSIYWGYVVNNMDGKLAQDFVLDPRSIEESYSPSHSLKISKTTVETDSVCGFAQEIRDNIPYNRKLTLTAMIKCKNLSSYGVSIAIRCDDKNGQNIQFVSTQNSQLINGTTDWKSYTISLDNVSSETDLILVYLIYLTNTTGSVYFDDIHLTYDE